MEMLHRESYNNTTLLYIFIDCDAIGFHLLQSTSIVFPSRNLDVCSLETNIETNMQARASVFYIIPVIKI